MLETFMCNAGPPHQLDREPSPQAQGTARPHSCRQDLQGFADQGPRREQAQALSARHMEAQQQQIFQAIPLSGSSLNGGSYKVTHWT